MILLPEREYNKEELKIICIHELIHCKHKDILWKQLCGLVRVIHWWNPLVKQLDRHNLLSSLLSILKYDK